MSNEANRTVIERYLAFLANRDNAGFRSMAHPDVIFEWPQTREPIRGAENMARIDRHYPAGCPIPSLGASWAWRINGSSIRCSFRAGLPVQATSGSPKRT